MKLNATTEMEPISLPGFANVHPFAPSGQFDGYQSLFTGLESWLAEIAGYDAVSLPFLAVVGEPLRRRSPAYPSRMA